jgi:hypothetical protein
VTTAFEVLQAETPPSGYGVGVCFAVAIPNGLAGVSRLVRANGLPILLCDEAIPVPGKNEPKRAEKITPCNDTSDCA